MASILSQVGNATNTPLQSFDADDVRDMWAIDVSKVPMGSRCYVINDGEWYVLNSLKQWKKVPSGGGYDPSTHYIWDGGKADGTWD